MKFTLSLLAALLGVVSASGHNGSANGTVTTVVSGGGGGGGGATTPTPTSGGDSANQTSFSAHLTLSVTLPSNVTSTDVSAVGTAGSEYTNHIRVPGSRACSTETTEAGKYVCFTLAVLNEYYKGKDADKAVMYGQPTATDARRRSLDETTARRLTTASIKYPLKLYVDSSKEDALKTSTRTAPTGAQLKTAADAIASDMPAGFAAAVSDLQNAEASVEVGTADTTTAASTTSEDTSSAFKMGASALAVVFSVVSLF